MGIENIRLPNNTIIRTINLSFSVIMFEYISMNNKKKRLKKKSVSKYNLFSSWHIINWTWFLTTCRMLC